MPDVESNSNDVGQTGMSEHGFGMTLGISSASDIRKTGAASGDRKLEDLGKLLDKNYVMSKAEAKEAVMNVVDAYPAIRNALSKSGIPITDETIPQIIEVTRKCLDIFGDFQWESCC